MLSSVLLAPSHLLSSVFDDEILSRIGAHSRLATPYFDATTLEANQKPLADAEVIFSTWGMPRMDAQFLDRVPNLRAVFYAAGSARGFVTDEVWERGITLCSAWRANAIPVSEFSLATILLSLKQTWAYHRRLKVERKKGERIPTKGAYHSTVGLISLGAIGYRVAELLRQFEVEVVAYDPFVSAESAAQLGIRLVALDELFEISDVVSLHTPWLKETEKMIAGNLLRRMKPHATFINTSRGAVVDEAALIEVLRERPDLTAILDVTFPEPPDSSSPLFDLPNALLTPHIAGSVGMECRRMGSSMVDEYLRFVRGEPLLHQVTRDSIQYMA